MFSYLRWLCTGIPKESLAFEELNRGQPGVFYYAFRRHTREMLGMAFHYQGSMALTKFGELSHRFIGSNNTGDMYFQPITSPEITRARCRYTERLQEAVSRVETDDYQNLYMYWGKVDGEMLWVRNGCGGDVGVTELYNRKGAMILQPTAYIDNFVGFKKVSDPSVTPITGAPFGSPLTDIAPPMIQLYQQITGDLPIGLDTTTVDELYPAFKTRREQVVKVNLAKYIKHDTTEIDIGVLMTPFWIAQCNQVPNDSTHVRLWMERVLYSVNNVDYMTIDKLVESPEYKALGIEITNYKGYCVRYMTSRGTVMSPNF